MGLDMAMAMAMDLGMFVGYAHYKGDSCLRRTLRMHRTTWTEPFVGDLSDFGPIGLSLGWDGKGSLGVWLYSGKARASFLRFSYAKLKRG